MDPEPTPLDQEAREKADKVVPRRLFAKLIILLVSVSISAALAEIGLRVFFRNSLFVIQDERNLMYQYDQSLGWFPIPNSKSRLFGSRVITVVHNSAGFRAPEPVPSDKPGIAFLGDSFVWGYDVEASERFTDKLQELHPEWKIENFGVSGYGTDQEYLLLQRYFDAYKPHVVFLLFCTDTDHEDNCSNMRYGGYYKPYCTISGNRLRLQGIPVPRSEKVFLAEHHQLSRSYLVRMLARSWFKLSAPPVLHNPNPTGALIRDLQKYVQAKGAIFVMGLTRSDPHLEEFLRFFKIPFVDLSTSLRYPHFGNHWTPEGHAFVCGRVNDFFVNGKYMESQASVSAAAPGAQSPSSARP